MGLGCDVRRLWDSVRRLPRGGVISVTCGFLLHLSLGIMYTFGNLTTYLTSYLHVRLGLPVDYGDTLWVGTVQGIVEGPGVLLGSICYRRFGPRLTILVGSVIYSSGMALTCLTVQSSFVATMMTYGVMCGLGVGLAYTSPMLAGYCWFPENRGLVSGTVVGGYGLGSIIFTSVQTSYLNPENVSPEDDGFFHDAALLDRVPSLFLVQAAIGASLQLFGVLGIHAPPPEAQLTESGSSGSIDATSTQVDASATDTDRNPVTQNVKDEVDVVEKEDPKAWWKYLLTVQTLQLMIAYAMNANGVSTANSFWKAFGQTFIKDDHFLAMVGIGSSVFNMLGRLVWGTVCDSIGYQPTMVIITGIMAALVFTFPSTALVGRGMFVVWAWAIFLSGAGTFSVVVTGTAATFGVQHAGQIYGVVFLSAAMCSPLVSLIAETVLDSWGYSSVYLLTGGLACISLTATLTFRHRGNAEIRSQANDVERTSM